MYGMKAGPICPEQKDQAGAWIMDIVHDSVVDGPGLRTVIFSAGCPHQCAGCHNPESWSMRSGRWQTVMDIVREAGSNPLTDITLSGGDPFIQAAAMSRIATELRRLGKNIWAYTGYTLEELLSANDRHQKQLLDCCDVIVDGRFEMEQRDLSLPFRGSRNQRIWEQQDGEWKQACDVPSPL